MGQAPLIAFFVSLNDEFYLLILVPRKVGVIKMPGDLAKSKVHKACNTFYRCCGMADGEGEIQWKTRAVWLA